jgi:protein-S-isoprenylcysteine O-methyltransferase Ste14
MFLRALVAFLALPGLAALAAPPLIAAFDPWRGGTVWAGGAVMLAGLVVVVWCVRDFYVAGKGTLAPWDPPKRLVVVGLYRHVRNPMYVGVLALTAGWAVTLASPVLAIYTVALAFGFDMRVRTYEEPHLASVFGDAWAAYSTHVRRWAPRFTPWRGG